MANDVHNDFLKGVKDQGDPIDLSGLPLPQNRPARPDNKVLNKVAAETGFKAGAGPQPEESVTAQFACRLRQSTLNEIKKLIEERGWSNRVFMERALKSLSAER
jgi:hypothetical protein